MSKRNQSNRQSKKSRKLQEQGSDRLVTGRKDANAEGDSSMAKKVGGSKKEKGKGKGKGEKKAKKEKVKKVVFETKSKDEKNADVLFTVAMPEGFDAKLHKPIGPKAFAGRHLHASHKATLMKAKGEALVVAAEILEKKAEKLSKMGDEKTRKSMKRAERVVKELGGLKAVLAAAGVSIADLLKEEGVDLTDDETEEEDETEE